MIISLELIRSILHDKLDAAHMITQNKVGLLRLDDLAEHIVAELEEVRRTEQDWREISGSLDKARAALDEAHLTHDADLDAIQKTCQHRDRHSDGDCKFCGHDTRR